MSDPIKPIPTESMIITRKALRGNLTAWDRVKTARHARRPGTLDYIQAMCTEFFEMHGDRALGDDPAVVGGFARFEDQPVMVIGHEKGKKTAGRLERNFGMANPDGFHKAVRLMELAARFGRPILTFIDTPGAFPGISAEEHGQHDAIAQCIAQMLRLPVPILVTVIGEGGSGGALALGAGDRVLMLENAIYSVISPEGCATILWRDASRAKEAAESLHLTAWDLHDLGIVEEVIPEPLGGAHRDRAMVFKRVRSRLSRGLIKLKALSPEQLLERRYRRFRRIGRYVLE